MTEYWLKTKKDLPLTARSQISKSSFMQGKAPLISSRGQRTQEEEGPWLGHPTQEKPQNRSLAYM